MIADAWLPVGYQLPDGAISKAVLFHGPNWQILETRGNGRALIVDEGLANRWIGVGLIDGGLFDSFTFGAQRLRSISCGPSHALAPVSEGKLPITKGDALAFAIAVQSTRAIDGDIGFQDALYVEKIGRLLPTYSISSQTDDSMVLGYWLTGGANVSAHSFRRVKQMVGWLREADLREIVRAAGLEMGEARSSAFDESLETSVGHKSHNGLTEKSNNPRSERRFELPGRPELESFFNEHVIDIVQNKERYAALGIYFPSAIVLHGPPGSGKTFAVEQLVAFLGWPSFEIDASSVASPYIHETSRKVAEVFERGMENAPSVLVVDEMEAFLADREIGSGHHRIEEVAEFLRRIPEASKNEVLIIAMTNRIEMIDSAVLRRGRFDHIIKVDYASEADIFALLEKLLGELPKEADVNPRALAGYLAGRPLSDVAYVVREGARLAARSGKGRIDQESLAAALAAAPVRTGDETAKGRIGFV
jgi:cell division protease FtsH